MKRIRVRFLFSVILSFILLLPIAGSWNALADPGLDNAAVPVYTPGDHWTIVTIDTVNVTTYIEVLAERNIVASSKTYEVYVLTSHSEATGPGYSIVTDKMTYLTVENLALVKTEAISTTSYTGSSSDIRVKQVVTYDPPAAELSFPLSIGAAWSSNSTVYFENETFVMGVSQGTVTSDATALSSGEVLKKDRITVAAGTFDVLVIDMTDASGNSMRAYYSAEAGRYVKIIYLGGSYGYGTTFSLTSYSHEHGEQFGDPDGDGYINKCDAFPKEGTQWNDTDGDGYGDNPEGAAADMFPEDPTQFSDIDGDGYGDNASGSNPDMFPDDPKEWTDSDGDGIGDNSDFAPTIKNQLIYLSVVAVAAVLLLFTITYLHVQSKRNRPELVRGRVLKENLDTCPICKGTLLGPRKFCRKCNYVYGDEGAEEDAENE